MHIGPEMMGGSQIHDISFEKLPQGGKKKKADEMWLKKASHTEMPSREGRENISWQNCHKNP